MKARRFPPLPAKIQGAGGEIAVVIVQHPGGDPNNNGEFLPDERRIEVAKSLRGDQRWRIFFHEEAHAALWDSGVHNLITDPNLEEAICDAISASRLRQRFG